MRHRTFITTLLLFLFFLNLGIFIVSSAMFQDTIKRAEDRSLAIHYFITSALTKDFYALESRGNDISNSLNTILQPYKTLSENRESGFALYKDNELVYYSNNIKNILTSDPDMPSDIENRLVTLHKTNEKTYVTVLGRLPIPYDSYTLFYFYDTTEPINSWKQLKNLLFLAGFILSCLLALGLLLVIHWLFKPLQQISKTAKDIANGEYETRLPIVGRDELAEMAQSFNYMAEEIQRQINELKDAAERKQQFVDNFAHELRTPMTAIYGYAEYMQKAVISEEDRLSALEYIMSESKRLQTLASQLLDMAKLRNNSIYFKEIKIFKLFEGVKNTMYGRLIGKDIQVEFKSEIDTLYGDATLLESLLVNLIDNAIMACDKQGRINICAFKENGLPVIIIKDNGKGISPDVLSKITEPFYRVDQSRNRNEGGAGLGLAICKEIAKNHGAKLSFTSELGKGTEVKVIFTNS